MQIEFISYCGFIIFLFWDFLVCWSIDYFHDDVIFC